MVRDMLKKERTKLRKLFLAWLESVGGAKNTAFLAGMYEWMVPTRAGALVLNLHDDDDAIFSRFEHPDKAARLIPASWGNLNTYSGKWNYHFDRSFTAESAMKRFTEDFERVRIQTKK